MSSPMESVHFLLAPANPQGLMDPHVPSVLLSQVIFQNLKQGVLSKTQVQLSDLDKLVKVVSLNQIQTKFSTTIQSVESHQCREH